MQTLSNVRNRQLLETKDQAIPVANRLLNGTDSCFELVELEKFNAVAKLRSQHYKNYHVLCYANALRSAGWLFCNFAKSGTCALKKHYLSSKPFKEARLDLNDTQAATEIVLGPFNFSDNYLLQHEHKLLEQQL